MTYFQPRPSAILFLLFLMLPNALHGQLMRKLDLSSSGRFNLSNPGETQNLPLDPLEEAV